MITNIPNSNSLDKLFLLEEDRVISSPSTDDKVHEIVTDQLMAIINNVCHDESAFSNHVQMIDIKDIQGDLRAIIGNFLLQNINSIDLQIKDELVEDLQNELSIQNQKIKKEDDDEQKIADSPIQSQIFHLYEAFLLDRNLLEFYPQYSGEEGKYIPQRLLNQTDKLFDQLISLNSDIEPMGHLMQEMAKANAIEFLQLAKNYQRLIDEAYELTIANQEIDVDQKTSILNIFFNSGLKVEEKFLEFVTIKYSYKDDLNPILNWLLSKL